MICHATLCCALLLAPMQVLYADLIMETLVRAEAHLAASPGLARNLGLASAETGGGSRHLLQASNQGTAAGSDPEAAAAAAMAAGPVSDNVAAGAAGGIPTRSVVRLDPAVWATAADAYGNNAWLTGWRMPAEPFFSGGWHTTRSR